MKSLQNPTTYFFKQAENPPNLYKDKIQDFVNKLINKKTCLLCKENFNITERIPRIMIHCGHTFCTVCLLNFFINRRVRCPMCLKLVKHLDSIQRLPINHTIFTQLINQDIEECKSKGIDPEIKDASKFLFSQFQRVQKQAHLQQNPQKIDPDSGLPFCTFHPDRVEHFFCCAHKTAGCRVCVQIGHTKPDCSVVDLYEIEDPQTFMLKNANQVNKKQEEKAINMNVFQNLQAHQFKNNILDDDLNGQQDFEDEQQSLNSI